MNNISGIIDSLTLKVGEDMTWDIIRLKMGSGSSKDVQINNKVSKSWITSLSMFLFLLLISVARIFSFSLFSKMLTFLFTGVASIPIAVTSASISLFVFLSMMAFWSRSWSTVSSPSSVTSSVVWISYVVPLLGALHYLAKWPFFPQL